MKPARLAVLAIALVAGGGAAYLMSGDDAPPPSPPAAQAPALPTTDVLVAAADMPMGQTLKPEDLRWQRWPDQALAPGYITRANAPKALEETAGSMTRATFIANEPIRSEKLVKAGSGFMSAILPAGMRAVAVEIQRGGSTSAGGFVLPNDHVDVISIGKGSAGINGEPIAQTILTDIRVLAVGQVVQERNGETVVTGDNATLALTPAQAEIVSLAQKTGAISLALRSIQDTGKTVETASAETAPEAGLTIVRFGVAQQQPRR
ncbi:Flp pilus assembly protein CpaB [Methylobacterium gnaphalii]|uniref:Flp pilus assembly protein CpaB n=1 Tax=Methylobacterium gnaphalii TaxID=1010610 RepID=A0A512JLU2_9HYPH|nr:Flp pilus assembly protein CpaB [Methylobacterium gnaphalii]GEP10925.1 Flp pilus assembly protein CpaB [Methylobacterium gnaphalii]GJD69781.1 hypothetical protein MMMDOFMJ_2719 [Methylobacterium gnaphalii]GLS48091.1 Flp pilus assembly protein CpaB [Methylobacterium gnaphalii]